MRVDVLEALADAYKKLAEKHGVSGEFEQESYYRGAHDGVRAAQALITDRTPVVR